MNITDDQLWKRKLIVKNLPDTCSNDLLQNFLEIVTRKEVAENGIEYFGGITHTALVTFMESLSDECVCEAQTRSQQKSVNKSIVTLLAVREAPLAILVSDLSSHHSHDNLFYYFDSHRSGCVDGNVNSCDIFPEIAMAVITFSSSNVTQSVLSVEEHYPTKDSIVHVKPCYTDFHIPLLKELCEQKNQRVNKMTETRTSSVDEFKSSADAEKSAAVKQKGFPHLGGLKKKPFRPTGSRLPFNNKPGLLPTPMQGIPSLLDIRVTPSSNNPGLFPTPVVEIGLLERNLSDVSTFHLQSSAEAWSQQPFKSPGKQNFPQSQQFLYNRSSQPQQALVNSTEQMRWSQKNSEQQRWGQTSSNDQQRWGQENSIEQQKWGRENSNEQQRWGTENSNEQQRWGRENRNEQQRWGRENSNEQQRWGRENSNEQQRWGRENSNEQQRWGRENSNEQQRCEQFSNAAKEDYFHIQENLTPNREESLPKKKNKKRKKRGKNKGQGCTEEVSLATDNASDENRHTEQCRGVGRGDYSRGGRKGKELFKCSPPMEEAELTAREEEFQDERVFSGQPHQNIHQDMVRLDAECNDLSPKDMHTSSTNHLFVPKSNNYGEDQVAANKSSVEARQNFDAIGKERLQAEVRQNLDAIEKERLQAELEQYKKENKKLKNQKTVRESVPGYRLRLLKYFTQNYDKCTVTISVEENVVTFCGAEEDCDEAKCSFLSLVQGLAEDKIQIPLQVTTLFQTVPGRQFLEQMCQTHPNCSVALEDDYLKCAAHAMNDVQTLINDLKLKICQESFKAFPSSLVSPQFSNLKSQLEKGYLVCLSPSPFSGEVVIHGIRQDVDHVLKELQELSRSYQQNKKQFYIAGVLAVQACKQWYGYLLDEIKELIRKHGGEVSEQPSPSGFMLTYLCPEELQGQVNDKLSIITNGIHTVCVDLRSKFTSYSDQALLINGLHSEEHFCPGLENSLRKEGIECILAITLPLRCPLPCNRIITKKTASQSRNPGQPGNASQCSSNTFLPQSDTHSSLKPFSVVVGKTIITIKSGDITEEKVDVIVNAVGEDLELSRTTLGNAILKKWTTAGEELFAQLDSVDPVSAKYSQVFVTQVPAGQSLQSSFLFHGVIGKWRSHSIPKHLQALIYDCLAKSVQLMQKSIAFPPLGTGRRFGFSEDVVAATMVSSTLEFLKKNPGLLQSIAFIVSDEWMILTLIQCLKAMTFDLDGAAVVNMSGLQKHNETAITVAKGISGGSTTNAGVSSEDGTSFVEIQEEIRNTSQNNPGRFEASICFRHLTDRDVVVDRLVMRLKETFLYQDSIKEMDAIKKLQQKDFDAIEKATVKNGVLVRAGQGSKAITLCGQQVGVAKVMAFIRDRLLAAHLQAKEESDKGKKQSHCFPSYWKLCKEHKFGDIEDFYKSKQKYEKLHIADSNERATIEYLIQNTWNHHIVGIGKDAVNLRHKSIQIIKVERMENPELWERYCEGRKMLLRCLENSKVGATFSFTPLEKAPNSKGPVRTTQLMSQDSLLHGEIYTQINEHYLFHGFKIEMKDAIIRDGLDFRVASDGAMLGRGVYAAESATKADQYADPKSQRTDGDKTMILMRVLLGEPYFNIDLNPPKFSRPPCKKCLKDKCTCVDSKHFDSVIDAFPGRNFREFVVYDTNKCYPEYFITYRRV